MNLNKIRGTVTCKVIEGNTGDSFQKTLRSSVSPSKGAAANGEGKYQTERMLAGRLTGHFPQEYVGVDKQIIFDTGHDYEDAVLVQGEVELMKERMREAEQRWKEARMKHAGTIMTAREHISVIIHPTPHEEYINSEWPNHKAHTDCFIQIVKGRAIENPNFRPGDKMKNYIIIPDAEDHWYIGDAKTCQTVFSDNWASKDENGAPNGGMRNGMWPREYEIQCGMYLGILAPLPVKFEGAFLLGSKGDHLDEHGHVQVFKEFDENWQDESYMQLDEAERLFRDAENGSLPAVRDCRDVAKAIAELPLQYPKAIPKAKPLYLDAAKWKPSFDRMVEIKTRLSEIADEKVAITEKVKQEAAALGIELSGSISFKTKEQKELEDEYSKILMLTLEDIKDAPEAYFTDPDEGVTAKIDVKRSLKMVQKTEDALKNDYPEVWESLQEFFPDVKVSLEDPRIKKAKKSKK